MKNTIILVLATLPFFAWAQTPITVEDIYEGVFSVNTVDEVRWMNDGRYYTALKDNQIVKYDITNGDAVETIMDGNTAEPFISIDDYDFSADESKLLIMTDKQGIYRRSYIANYFIYDRSVETITPLSENGEQSYATFSPDGKAIAFTRRNNLYYVTIDDMEEIAVTTDGRFNYRIHASADWVYEEEFSITKTFSWSPDSRKLAYISFDESDVMQFNMQFWSEDDLYPIDYRFKYPKAGESNSLVTVTIHDLKSAEKVAVDIGNETDIYIPRLKWTRDPEILSIIRMNRLQNKLEILHANASTRRSEIVYIDESDTYIDLDYVDDLNYLRDGKHFITSSERTGYKHLFLYDISGKMIRQITSGEWEVTEFIGLKEDTRRDRSKVYFISTETSSLDRTVYQIDLSGKNKIMLSPGEGTSEVDMSRDFSYYILNYESNETPLKVSLHQLGNDKATKIKELETNEELAKRIEKYQLATKEFYQFKSADGRDLNGFMLKPNDFDPSEKYPVLIYQYSGPGSQEVENKWSGGDQRLMWHQMLVQNGYIVAYHDTRGTGYNGVDLKKMTYKQLGKYETEDHIAGAKYLASLPYIDPERIGIWGWSYGGYISSLAMFKGADIFSAGIAVAPVTTWRFYDTIYTERYLQRPQDNPAGYDDNSPITHASKLKGKYLLVHGTGDDNVHFQNTIMLQNELILHGKQFDSFYYPNRAHSIADYNARVHLYNMMTNFIYENL